MICEGERKGINTLMFLSMVLNCQVKQREEVVII